MRQKRQIFFRLFVIIFLYGVLCGTVGCQKQEEPRISEITEIEEPPKEETEVSEDTEKPEFIYVYVCGQVRNPGVYKLEAGERITHALMAAGGMTDQASPDYLNQAEELVDGQKIYVPTREEALSMETKTAGEEAVSDGKVNLNTADKTQLMQLPGIGEARAEAIIRYRDQNGGFGSIEEIKNIEGIKEGIFNRIKDQIKVE